MVRVARTTQSPLPDHLATHLRALFVGINPGLRSAETGHHYAGAANRFWSVLHQSGLLPEPWGFERDADLLRLGFGLTNIVSRPTRGISDLQSDDFDRGRRELCEKIRQYKPRTVVFVGLMVFDHYFGAAAGRAAAAAGRRTGAQRESIEGCPLFVVPNPSGRNAHWTPRAMVQAYAALRQWLDRR